MFFSWLCSWVNYTFTCRMSTLGTISYATWIGYSGALVSQGWRIFRRSKGCFHGGGFPNHLVNSPECSDNSGLIKLWKKSPPNIVVVMMRLTFVRSAFLREEGVIPPSRISRTCRRSHGQGRHYDGHCVVLFSMGETPTLSFELTSFGCLPPITWVKPSLFETRISARKSGKGFLDLPARGNKKTMCESDLGDLFFLRAER